MHIKKIDNDSVREFLKDIEIGEPIDWECDFLGFFNGSLAGIAGVNVKKEHPLFEHIIVAKHYQRTRVAVLLMIAIEKYLKELGFNDYWSFVRNERSQMQTYASKWGMTIHQVLGDGIWFFKNIGDK